MLDNLKIIYWRLFLNTGWYCCMTNSGLKVMFWDGFKWVNRLNETMPLPKFLHVRSFYNDECRY